MAKFKTIKLIFVRSKLFRLTSFIIFLHFLIPWIFIGELSAQYIKSLHPNKPIKTLVLKQWTAEDGLISNNLTSVITDQRGFLLITCFNGALRFDGNNFELFDRENLPFLNSNAFVDFFADQDGTIWLATQASGIVKYRNSTFSYPAFNEDLPKNIKAVYVDKNKNLWVGSNNSGLFKVSSEKVTKIDYPALSGSTIMSITGDEKGKIYVGTYQHGLVVIDDKVFKEYNTQNGLYSNDINTLFISSNKSLFIGTTEGLDELTGGHIHHIDFLKDTEINKIIEDGFGSLWVATEMGLARMNDIYQVKEFFGTSDGLPTRQVSGLCFDHEGNLWLSTKKGGLLRLKYGNFVNYTETDGLALNQVNIVVEKKPGIYYVGSDDGAINIISGGKVYDYPLKTNLYHNGIRDICFNGDEVWIGSYSGLLIKRGEEERLLTRTNGLPADDIRRIFRDSKYSIWVATRTGGLLKFENGSLLKTYNKSNGLGANYVLCIQEDKENNIWVGTNGGGLNKIEKNGEISQYNIYNDPSGILIFNICVDNSNKLWLATNVGIFLFDGKQFRDIQLKSTSQNDTFFDIIFDDLEDAWMTSNIGLYRVKKDNLESYLNGRSDEVATTIYDHNDGLRNKECTGATRSLKASNGMLWIPTLGGVATINPSSTIINKIEPPVYVTDFLTDRSGEFLSEGLAGDNLVLDPGNFRYRIKFTALSFQAPQKVRFRYRLDNIDKEWTEVVNIREVQYTNLPPGQYTFRVMASNNDNIWNEHAASFSFQVKPFLYQRTELYVITFILLSIVAIVGYRWRINSIEKRNKELKRINEELDKFVYSASHDLRAPLTSIMGLVNLAKQDGNTGNTTLYLKMIEDSIGRLEHFINDIIDYSRNSSVAVKSSVIDFNSLLDETISELKYLRENGDIKINVNIKGEKEFVTDSRRIRVILNNLISNAIKYHDLKKSQKYVNIDISYNEQKANIVVSDNGSGIAQEHHQKIFDMFYRASEGNDGSGLGLYIVKETLEKLNGTINLASKSDEGTTFTMQIPAIRSKS